MTTPTRPMLAAKVEDLSALRYPLLASPKVDGIRCIKLGGLALSRSFKPIPNNFIQNWIRNNCPDGWDGELIVPGTSFEETSGAVRRHWGDPDFQWLVFDDATQPRWQYQMRLACLEASYQDAPLAWPRVQLLPFVWLYNELDLVNYEQHCWNAGYEGICLRSPDGPYKSGRSTFREQWLLKLKRYEDDEAVVIAAVPLQRNHNAAKLNELGLTKRSKKMDGLVTTDLLGAFVVSHPTFGTFEVGTGYTLAQRETYWRNLSSYVGKTLTFRYCKRHKDHHEKPAPASFKGWRHDFDLDPTPALN